MPAIGRGSGLRARRILRENLAMLRGWLDEAGTPLPAFVDRELEKAFECGDASLGFARVRCATCAVDIAVPASCKGRAFCPSCTGRRMADLAAWMRFSSERGESIGGDLPASRKHEPDHVERLFAAIEQNAKSFQRDLNRRKVRQIRDFYRNENQQPVVPGAVLLFTSEELEFAPVGSFDRAGDLRPPKGQSCSAAADPPATAPPGLGRRC